MPTFSILFWVTLIKEPTHIIVCSDPDVVCSVCSAESVPVIYNI